MGCRITFDDFKFQNIVCFLLCRFFLSFIQKKLHTILCCFLFCVLGLISTCSSEFSIDLSMICRLEYFYVILCDVQTMIGASTNRVARDILYMMLINLSYFQRCF